MNAQDKAVSGKLWGGRFSKSTEDVVERYTHSLAYDRRLWRHDVRASMAHARMLASCGIIAPQDLTAIERGLSEIGSAIEAGTLRLEAEDEDIHMAIERVLTEKVGQAGARLHTARSRNDQVATDLRLFLREELDELMGRVRELQRALVTRAQEDTETVLPGYTHLQRAQPVLLAHHLLAYVWMLERDAGRVTDCRRRLNELPLGAGALAGTSLPIDRESVAEILGFDRVMPNSLDAVASRDFALEALAALAILAGTMSRLGEEIVLWSSEEFGFARLDDAYATGSSMMPQKKNPDVAELVRGRSGRVAGHLMALLMAVKGLPLAYNRDLQEDKEGLFDALDTVNLGLEALAGLMSTVRFETEAMQAAASDQFPLTTDVMEYLVCKGVPLRNAHMAVGELVAYCSEHGILLSEVPLEQWRRFSPAFEEDVYTLLTSRASVKGKRSAGSTSPTSVVRQIAAARKLLGLVSDE